MASTADLDNIAKRRTPQAGNHANATGKGRQRTLAIEETFGPKPLLQALYLREKRAKACLLDPVDNELQLTAVFIDGQLAVQFDGITITRLESKERCLAAEDDGRKLRIAVLDSEVTVATSSGTPVRDLSFQRHPGKPVFNDAANVPHQAAHRPSLRKWGRTGLGGGSFSERG